MNLLKSVFTSALAVIISVATLTAAAPKRTFSDVAPGSWYEKEVMDMAASGWLTGYPNGTFQPSRPITAAELVTVVARCAGAKKTASTSKHWAAGWLQTGLDQGWYKWDEIPPMGDKFDRPIQRQVAVEILMNALLPDVRGDYNTESRKMKDFSQLDGRYYNTVLAAYSVGVVKGDNRKRFNPQKSLTRAEACMLIYRAKKLTGTSVKPSPDPAPSQSPDPQPPTPVETVSGGIKENGWLQVLGTQLCNEDGDPVVLRGMSSHGIQWYGNFTSEQAIKNTASFGANLFRVAMYTKEGGYIEHKDAIRKKVIEAVDAAIRQDMYVIIDWHILSDGNPKTHMEEAKTFFTQMAERYKDQPGVLYEICNEPNGNVDWGRDIKPYAEQMVKTIRAKSPKSVILIGSSTWSQDVHLAAANPVKGDNLMYTLHFYAGTHQKWLRDRVDQAMNAGLPIFVSEWGTSAADGNSGVYLDEARKWIDFMDQRGISWANWSLCDKNETSAALKPGTSPNSTWTEKDLSDSGKFVFGQFK